MCGVAVNVCSRCFCCLVFSLHRYLSVSVVFGLYRCCLLLEFGTRLKFKKTVRVEFACDLVAAAPVGPYAMPKNV